ncbi:N-acetylglucosamine kinase [Streptomyces lasalocidi]|uniref:ATPase n=1 Tax=Streptomyces lasalocidi TaxID=324833 RepID=A0A4U5WCU5_STRLS|nr:BadF/BadG/BcrA/BcrD ATPase family protein [Streptomyces lasalocidi]TKS99498.1 ATPase [Streptomyces lasalocidi]
MTGGPPRRPGVLAVDSGGSGLRVAVRVVESEAGAHGAVPQEAGSRGDGLREAGSLGGVPRDAVAEVATKEPVRTGPRGIDPEHLMEQLVPAVRALTAETEVSHLAAAAVGAAGFGTLGDALRAELPGALAREFGVRRVALAADAVTAYVGALGVRPGAVVAAGTGLIALGTDLARWRRADGWGHLLGDCGGGAWIGRAGLEAAVRAHDGRPRGSAALLACAEEEFGPVTGLPALLYPRADRPAVLASFAPRVADCAATDPVAADILRAAAGHMADSAAAVCPAGDGARVALTGGLFRTGEALLTPVREELARRLPHARPVPAEGDPLHGATALATALARGTLALPLDASLLHVVTSATEQVEGTVGDKSYGKHADHF